MNTSPAICHDYGIQVLPVCVISNKKYMESQNSLVAWIALILSIIAAILAWMAFNRSGTDLEAVMQEQMNEAMTEIRADMDALEAEMRSSTADQLDEAADDVRTDDEMGTTTP